MNIVHCMQIHCIWFRNAKLPKQTSTERRLDGGRERRESNLEATMSIHKTANNWSATGQDLMGGLTVRNDVYAGFAIQLAP